MSLGKTFARKETYSMFENKMTVSKKFKEIIWLIKIRK